MADAPIRTHSRRAFIVGWIAIVATGILGFTLAVLPLNHSHENTRVAHTTQIGQSETPRS